MTIRKETDRYRLRDETLNDSDDAEYVRTELHLTLLRINVLARLQWGKDHDDARPGAVGHPNNGGIAWYGSATLTARLKISATGIVIGPDGEVVPDPPDPLPKKLRLAMTDRNVDDALYFLQRRDPS